MRYERVGSPPFGAQPRGARPVRARPLGGQPAGVPARHPGRRVWPAAAAPSTQGEDTTISASKSRSTSWVTGASIVDPQSTWIEVDVEIYPTGWDLPAGHKLQLTLQTADVPHLTASTQETLASGGATLSIYHDAQHPSELVVPVRSS